MILLTESRAIDLAKYDRVFYDKINLENYEICVSKSWPSKYSHQNDFVISVKTETLAKNLIRDIAIEWSKKTDLYDIKERLIYLNV